MVSSDKSALIQLQFLTVAQHKSGTRKKKLYLGQWPDITTIYPANAMWQLK